MSAGAADIRRGAGADPSGFGHRAALAALSLVGMAIAAYLGAYQAGLLPAVWDPVFGTGSVTVLTSNVATAFPIPDAWLGAAAYLVETGLALVGGPHRWRERPRIVLTYGALAGLMALAGIALVAIQVVWFRTGCLLCLVSAAISIVLAIGVRPEVAAALGRPR